MNETAGAGGRLEAEGGGGGEDKGDYGDFYEYDYSNSKQGTTTPRDVNVKCILTKLIRNSFFCKLPLNVRSSFWQILVEVAFLTYD